MFSYIVNGYMTFSHGVYANEGVMTVLSVESDSLYCVHAQLSTLLIHLSS